MIYVIESGDYFKVGYSTNIDKRMVCYRTHNPNFELVFTNEGTKGLEKFIHINMASFQHQTEWFKCYDNYLGDIKNIILLYTGAKEVKIVNKPTKNKISYDRFISNLISSITEDELNSLYNSNILVNKEYGLCIKPYFISSTIEKSLLKKLEKMNLVNTSFTYNGQVAAFNYLNY